MYYTDTQFSRYLLISPCIRQYPLAQRSVASDDGHDSGQKLHSDEESDFAVQDPQTEVRKEGDTTTLATLLKHFPFVVWFWVALISWYHSKKYDIMYDAMYDIDFSYHKIQ